VLDGGVVKLAGPAAGLLVNDEVGRLYLGVERPVGAPQPA